MDGEKQGLGIGSQIIADLRATLKALNFNTLQLRVQKDNEDAIDFWKKQGFILKDEEITINNRVVRSMEKKI